MNKAGKKENWVALNSWQSARRKFGERRRKLLPTIAGVPLAIF